MEKETIEQLIRTLEWYEKVATHMGNCVLDKDTTKACLNAIKGLNELKESYRQELGDVRFALAEANNDKKKLAEENEFLRRLYSKDMLDVVDYAVDKIRLAKSDTAKKIHFEIKRRCTEGGIYPAFVASVIEQVVKELTDETGE